MNTVDKCSNIDISGTENTTLVVSQPVTGVDVLNNNGGATAALSCELYYR